eukprot:Nk52_evm64s554 gene=Nk52_evmTU64s554
MKNTFRFCSSVLLLLFSLEGVVQKGLADIQSTDKWASAAEVKFLYRRFNTDVAVYSQDVDSAAYVPFALLRASTQYEQYQDSLKFEIHENNADDFEIVENDLSSSLKMRNAKAKECYEPNKVSSLCASLRILVFREGSKKDPMDVEIYVSSIEEMMKVSLEHRVTATKGQFKGKEVVGFDKQTDMAGYVRVGELAIVGVSYDELREDSPFNIIQQADSQSFKITREEFWQERKRRFRYFLEVLNGDLSVNVYKQLNTVEIEGFDNQENTYFSIGIKLLVVPQSDVFLKPPEPPTSPEDEFSDILANQKQHSDIVNGVSTLEDKKAQPIIGLPTTVSPMVVTPRTKLYSKADNISPTVYYYSLPGLVLATFLMVFLSFSILARPVIR